MSLNGKLLVDEVIIDNDIIYCEKTTFNWQPEQTTGTDVVNFTSGRSDSGAEVTPGMLKLSFANISANIKVIETLINNGKYFYNTMKISGTTREGLRYAFTTTNNIRTTALSLSLGTNDAIGQEVEFKFSGYKFTTA